MISGIDMRLTNGSEHGAPGLAAALTEKTGGALRRIAGDYRPVSVMLVLATLMAGLLSYAQTSSKTAPISQPPRVSGAATGSVVQSVPGPWGQLEEIRINTEPPEDFVAQHYRYGTAQWVLPIYNREQVVQLFKSARLSDAQQKSLFRDAVENPLAGGWTFRPDKELLLSLTPESRRRLYLALAEFPQNAAQYEPFRWRAESLDEWFANSGVSDETVNLVKKLLYYRGQAVLFADPELVLATLNQPEDRLRLLKTLSRQSTLLVKLTLRPDSDIDKLVEYWGRGGRSTDIRPLLDSLVKVPEGCSLDIVHLLPRFARQRLYTYPILNQGFVDPKYDCHWSSMNFWNDPPDNRLGEDPRYAREVLERDYDLVGKPYALGDLLFLTNGNRDAIHSAAYIADDIVFTKNGSSIISPWILMRLSRLVSYYENQDDDLQLLVYRRKDNK